MSTNSHIGEQHTNLGNDEISLKELILKIQEWWRYLWSKKIIIIGFGLLGGILGFVYANFQKLTYTATTTFVLEGSDAGGGLGQYAGLASMVGIDLGNGSGGSIFQGDNILELYKSRTMLEKTLLTPVEIDGHKQTLMEYYIIINKLRDDWREKSELLKLNFSASTRLKTNSSDSKHQRLRDSILGKAIEDINKNYLSVTKPDKKLSIIKVDVKSKNEIFAKQFNDEIVRNVNDFYYQTKTKKYADNVAILQVKADSVRAAMSGAIYTMANVSDATPNLNPTRQAQRIAPVQRAQFSAETNKAILSSLVQNLELTKMTLLKETPLIQVIDKPVFPLQSEKYSKLKGLIFGGLLFGFMIVIFFTVKKVITDVI